MHSRVTVNVAALGVLLAQASRHCERVGRGSEEKDQRPACMLAE